MSVAAIPSPASRFKRQFEGEAGLSPEHPAAGHYEAPDAHRHKRTRLVHLHHRATSPAAARTQLEQAIASLLALFPGMDEKVVQEVLLECGSIDAAIKRLTDLKLSSDDATVAAAVAVAGASAATPDARQAHQQQPPSLVPTPGGGATQPPSPPNGILSPPPDAAAAAVLRDAERQATESAAAAAAAAAQQQQQQQGPAAGPGGAAAAAGVAPQGPQTAEQWVDYLVVEMLASKDMGDAKGRAATVLQHFERFVKQHHKDEADARFAEVAKENQILKRAVQIQAQRAQHRALQEEQQLAELRAAVAHYQEQCRRLEVNNYSLAMHLQQATSGSGGMGPYNPRNPDVY